MEIGKSQEKEATKLVQGGKVKVQNNLFPVNTKKVREAKKRLHPESAFSPPRKIGGEK